MLSGQWRTRKTGTPIQTGCPVEIHSRTTRERAFASRESTAPDWEEGPCIRADSREALGDLSVTGVTSNNRTLEALDGRDVRKAPGLFDFCITLYLTVAVKRGSIEQETRQ